MDFLLYQIKYIKTENTDSYTINSILLWIITRFVEVASLEPFDSAPLEFFSIKKASIKSQKPKFSLTNKKFKPVQYYKG